MPKPKVTKAATSKMFEEVERRLSAGFASLVNKHIGDIRDIVEGSEKSRCRISLKILVDCSEREPILKITQKQDGIETTDPLAEGVTIKLEDPDQMPLFGGNGDAAEPPEPAEPAERPHVVSADENKPKARKRGKGAREAAPDVALPA